MKKTGHPETVYCNGWKPKSDHLRHELLLTDFLLCYPEFAVVRGWLVNQRIRPDAEMRNGETKLNVELDTGKQTYRMVQRRQKEAYADEQDLLLYVTLTERRMAGLIQHSEAVKDIALFTTLERVQADPDGEIWVDWFGGTSAIGGEG